jgi:hypothetical protein
MRHTDPAHRPVTKPTHSHLRDGPGSPGSGVRPNAAPWIAATERLIRAYAHDRRRVAGPGARIVENYVVMASDCVWECDGLRADWARLDVAALCRMFDPFLMVPGFATGLCTELIAFYDFLVADGRVAHNRARRIQYALLDVLQRESPQLAVHIRDGMG